MSLNIFNISVRLTMYFIMRDAWDENIILFSISYYKL